MVVMRNKDDEYIFISRMIDDCTLVVKADKEHYLNISIDNIIKFYADKGYKMVN